MTSKEIIGIFFASVAIIWLASKAGNGASSNANNSTAGAVWQGGEASLEWAENVGQGGASNNWQAYAKSNGPFLAISAAELSSESKKGANMILFVSSDGCGYSREFEPVLRNYLNNNNLQVANLNFSKERNYIDFNKLQNILGERAGATPYVYAIRNGKVVDTLKNRNNSKSVDDFFHQNAYLMQSSRAN